MPSHCGNYGNCAPYGITAGPDGNLWFTLSLGNAIGLPFVVAGSIKAAYDIALWTLFRRVTIEEP